MSDLNSRNVEALRAETENVYLMAHGTRGYDIDHTWYTATFF